MIFFKHLILALCSLLLFTPMLDAQAQEENKDPIEITAAGFLKWDREQKIFVAEKDALAVRDTTKIQADTLKAFYREPEGGDTEIFKFEASGNVRITVNNGEQKVFGDKAIYNLDKEHAIITGNDLKLITEEQVVTAKKSLEYDVNKKEMKAVGSAKAVQDDDSLESETIIARLRTNSAGDDEIYKLEAIKNVVIKTPTETAKGQKGVYDLDSDTAELTGGVTILRGPNTLLGERALVDLNTNISTLYGGEKSPSGNGRVRAVFFPDSLDNDDESGDTP